MKLLKIANNTLWSLVLLTVTCHSYSRYITEIKVSKLPSGYERAELFLPELNTISCPPGGGRFRLDHPIDIDQPLAKYWEEDCFGELQIKTPQDNQSSIIGNNGTIACMFYAFGSLQVPDSSFLSVNIFKDLLTASLKGEKKYSLELSITFYANLFFFPPPSLPQKTVHGNFRLKEIPIS